MHLYLILHFFLNFHFPIQAQVTAPNNSPKTEPVKASFAVMQIGDKVILHSELRDYVHLRQLFKELQSTEAQKKIASIKPENKEAYLNILRVFASKEWAQKYKSKKIISKEELNSASLEMVLATHGEYQKIEPKFPFKGEMVLAAVSEKVEKLDPTFFYKCLNRYFISQEVLSSKIDSVQVNPTSAQIEDYYQKNKSKFGSRPLAEFERVIREKLRQNAQDSAMNDWFLNLKERYLVKSELPQPDFSRFDWAPTPWQQVEKNAVKPIKN